MVGVCLIWNLTFIGTLWVLNHFSGRFDSWDIWKTSLNFLSIVKCQCILHIFKNWASNFALRFEKYIKLLGIFGDAISKCPDIIRKNTPLLAHNLDCSPSIELKLLVNQFESPCSSTKTRSNTMCQKEKQNKINYFYYEW